MQATVLRVGARAMGNSPKRSLGQNFLVDQGMIARIVQHAFDLADQFFVMAKTQLCASNAIRAV